MKKNKRRTCTCFLDKYERLSVYDIYIEKTYWIDDYDIQFVKGYEYDLIVYPDHPYRTSTNHEFLFIRDNVFNIILENTQNLDIALKVIHKEVSFS